MKASAIYRTGGMLLATGLMSGFAIAQTATVPDAQVESNVIRQLATAPDLSTQNIQSTTVYGVVTLTGNVHDETMRSEAENLVARAQGVNKVIDQLTLGDAPPANDNQPGQDDAANNPAAVDGNQAPVDQNQASANGPGPGMVLQSDGTYAPAAGTGNDQQAADQGQPPMPPNQDQAYSGQPQPPADYGQNGEQQGPPPAPHQPMNGYAQPLSGGPYAGQRAGIPVTVPAGTALQVRLNRGFNSDDVKPGTTFTGVVMYDIVSNGVVAIPRGATVSGTVVDAKRAGAFRGKGELSLQITSLTLGGNVYPFTSAVWDARGRDKTGHTVGNAIGMGVLGALIGGAAGGGAGAAIGAGVGAGAGVAVTGAQPGGQIMLPPETMLQFSLAEPANVTTVSEQEMARLSYAAGPPPRPRRGYRRRYYSPYYGYYYGPGM